MADIYGFSNTGLSSATFAGAALLIVLIVFLLILNRVKKSSKSGSFSTGAGLNLLELKKKGLLTPEELERVSGAIVKQMSLKEEAERRKKGVPTPESLLLDPEVRRLEALASITKKEPQMPLESPQIMTPPAASAADQDLSEVELPLDVIQLMDAGLLSPEEVENVKRRILARKQAHH